MRGRLVRQDLALEDQHPGRTAVRLDGYAVPAGNPLRARDRSHDQDQVMPMRSCCLTILHCRMLWSDSRRAAAKIIPRDRLINRVSPLLIAREHSAALRRCVAQTVQKSTRYAAGRRFPAGRAASQVTLWRGGHDVPSQGAPTIPSYWVATAVEGRKAVEELAASQGRQRQDLGRRKGRQVSRS